MSVINTCEKKSAPKEEPSSIFPSWPPLDWIKRLGEDTPSSPTCGWTMNLLGRF